MIFSWMDRALFKGESRRKNIILITIDFYYWTGENYRYGDFRVE